MITIMKNKIIEVLEKKKGNPVSRRKKTRKIFGTI